MAIGRTTLERAGQLPKDVTTKFDVSYADIVHDCLLYPGFTSVQVLLLLSLYSLFDSGYPSTWSLLCIASRQVVELGLTRRDDRADRDVAERCHRLFWSVYTLDRQMATSLGVPAALVDENMVGTRLFLVLYLPLSYRGHVYVYIAGFIDFEFTSYARYTATEPNH